MTKKCKSCQTDIDVKAKKCPNCQADQRNWIARHPILTGILVLILIGIIGGAVGSSSPKKVGTTDQTINQGTTPTQASDNAPKTQTFKMGDKVDLNGKTVTVNSVAPYTSNNQFMQPKNGNKFVTVDISLTNTSKDAFDYNVLDFRLQDNQSYSYTNAATDHEPYLTTGALQPGQTTRGFIDYEIPGNNTPTQVVFTPGFLSTSQIIITLTK